MANNQNNTDTPVNRTNSSTNENDTIEKCLAEQYLANRLEKERDYYDTRADRYRAKYMRNQTWIIVFGAIIPIITVFETSFDSWEVFKEWHLGSIANAMIAAAIAILAGLDKLHQNQSRWNIMRYCAQMLKREKELYHNRVGDYDDKSEKDAKKALVKRTEGILYYDIASTLQFTQKGDGQELGSGEKNANSSNQKQSNN